MKSIQTYLLLAIGSCAMAQVNPPADGPPPMPQRDTTSVNTQLQKESDLKTMDAVKTREHEKVTPKPVRDTVPPPVQKNRPKRK